MLEEKDQVQEVEETTADETVEATETIEEQSKEPEKEPITLERTYELAKAVQKGLTLNFQEKADIKRNLSSIQEAINNLSQKKDEYGFVEEKPITKKDILDAIREVEEQKQLEKQREIQSIDSQLNEIYALGKVSPAQEEDFLNYATKHRIRNLSQAADIWAELQEARKEGIKTISKAKAQVKQEEGSKIGNSSKVQTEEKGIDYGEIRTQSFDEIARQALQQ